MRLRRWCGAARRFGSPIPIPLILASTASPIAETGALLAALRAMLNGVRFESIGKPHPHLAALALSRTGVSADEAVFVGDNPATDGAIARAAGTRFIQLQRVGAPA